MSIGNTDELFGVLKTQLRKYPDMREKDLGKLLYQNEFGPAHFSGTKEEALAGLKEEFASVDYEEDAELYEPIGHGLFRVNLAAVDTKEYPPVRIARDFAETAASMTGTLYGLREKTDWVTEHFSEFRFAFSTEEWQSFLEGWESDGYPPLSHSDVYKKAYDPHYRLVDGSHRHDFRAEKEAKTPKAKRVLMRIVIALAFALLAVGLAVLGNHLYRVLVLK